MKLTVGGGAEVASPPAGEAGVGIAVAYLDVSGWHVHRGDVTADVPAGLHPRAWSYSADQLVLVDDTGAAFTLGPRAAAEPHGLCSRCRVLPIGATDAGGFVRLDASGLTWMTADGRDVQTVHALAQPPGTTGDVVAAASDWAMVTYSAADGTHTVTVVPRAGTPRVYLPPDAFYNVPLRVGVVNPDGLRASIPSRSRDDPCVLSDQLMSFDVRITDPNLVEFEAAPGIDDQPQLGHRSPVVEDVAMSTDGFVSAAWSQGGADGSRTTPCAGDKNVGPNTYRYASSTVGWVLIDRMSCGTRAADADHRLRCRPTGDTSELIEEDSGRSKVVASGVREMVFSPMTAAP